MNETIGTSRPEDLEEAWSLRDANPERAQQLIRKVKARETDCETTARSAVLEAFLLYRQAELHEALPLVLSAVPQLGESPLSYWDGRASNTAGLIYSGLGLSELAVQFLLAGQKQTQEVGDFETAFSCLHNMGVELCQIGDYDGALESYRQAERYADAGEDGHAFLALNRCDLYLDKGDIAMAHATAIEAKEHWHKANSQTQMFGLIVKSRVMLASSNPDEAEVALKAIRAQYDPTRTGPEVPMLEARLCMLRNDPDGAEAVLDAHDMGETTSAVEDVYLASRLVQIHAELAESRGDYQRALEIVRAARTKERRESRQAMSRVTTLIMKENTRQLEEKSRQLEEQNTQLNDAMEELRLLHEQVIELALKDHLTGLGNRRYLSEHMEVLTEQHARYGRNLSLVVFDIDNFKSINDTYLHSTGDLVLKQVAELLKSQARASDIMCRLGGDEFVALLPETSVEGALTMAQRIHDAVSSFEWSSVADGLSVGVSVGATTAEAGTSLEELLKVADREMYNAKSAGKNQIRIG